MKKKKPKRRDLTAQELWSPKYSMKVCRDRTKYHRKEKHSKGRFDSGSFLGFCLELPNLSIISK